HLGHGAAGAAVLLEQFFQAVLGLGVAHAVGGALLAGGEDVGGAEGVAVDGDFFHTFRGQGGPGVAQNQDGAGANETGKPRRHLPSPVSGVASEAGNGLVITAGRLKGEGKRPSGRPSQGLAVRPGSSAGPFGCRSVSSDRPLTARRSCWAIVSSRPT